MSSVISVGAARPGIRPWKSRHRPTPRAWRLRLFGVQPALRHGFGIAAHAFSSFFFFCGFVGYINEFAAQGFNLFFHTGRTSDASITAPKRLAVAMACRASNTHAQNHHTGCFDRARRSHQHREKTLVFVRRHHHSFVARDIGLAEDSTSMLCARVVRGAASNAKPVTPAAAKRCKPSASNGFSMPTKVRRI
jgi:hypothetical protein